MISGRAVAAHSGRGERDSVAYVRGEHQAVLWRVVEEQAAQVVQS